jgi:hypothetical protein
VRQRVPRGWRQKMTILLLQTPRAESMRQKSSAGNFAQILRENRRT